jgi:hypothetical protein
MDSIIPLRIQIVSIVGSVLFLMVIGRLIFKGKLREEYAIVWIAATAALLLLSIWRNGLELLAVFLGVFYAPSLLFLVALFAITTFLVHLSVVATKLQRQNKILAQDLALLRNELQNKKTQTPCR